MEFGIIAWGGIASSKLNKVIMVQKKCVRNVAGKGYRSHTDPLFSKFSIMKLEDLFVYSSCSFMHKWINGKSPISFKNTFTTLPNPNRTNSLQLEKYKNNFLLQFPSHFLPKLWNLNPVDLKLTESHKTFKKLLKEVIVSKYSTHVKCNSVTCPDCR